jgi:hypothetical protein
MPISVAVTAMLSKTEVPGRRRLWLTLTEAATLGA